MSSSMCYIWPQTIKMCVIYSSIWLWMLIMMLIDYSCLIILLLLLSNFVLLEQYQFSWIIECYFVVLSESSCSSWSHFASDFIVSSQHYFGLQNGQCPSTSNCFAVSATVLCAVQLTWTYNWSCFFGILWFFKIINWFFLWKSQSWILSLIFLNYKCHIIN